MDQQMKWSKGKTIGQHQADASQHKERNYRTAGTGLQLVQKSSPVEMVETIRWQCTADLTYCREELVATHSGKEFNR